jgi:hypothetical protein
MNVGELNKEIKRLQGLKSNTDASEAFIAKQAEINLRIRHFKQSPMFPDAKEQKLAQARFEEYLKSYEIESDSEIDLLRSLIFNEVFELRLQTELNNLATEKKSPNPNILKQLTEIQNQKIIIRKRLGFNKEEEHQDELTGLQVLKKRFEKYINENKNEFTTVCPHGSIMLLRRRVKNFDSMKHPWFAGRWLFNYEILKDVKDGKLSKEDAWRYLSCASRGGEYKPAFDKQYCTDYIDYCLKHWREITSNITQN